ncbi:MAG TPA: YhgE/Pip family protein, partial [Candidatus Limnocylindrales bacterium]
EAGNVADSGTTLKDDARQLASNLDATAGSMHSYAADTRERMGELAADPVAIEAERLNGASGPGGGLAPFFLALAIWLGALGVFVVLPGIWWAGRQRWSRATLVAFGAAAGLVGIGAVLAVFGLRLVGIEVAQLPELLLFAGLTALVSVAIVQALVAPLGARGWLLALMFLVVQVAAVGFLSPASTSNGLVAALHTMVPMTYAVDAFRGAINGGGSSPAVDAVVLAGWLVVTLLVTLAVAAGSGLRDEEAEPSAA